jgi:hypothetical protein
MAQIERVWMTFPDGGRGQVAVTPLGGGRYRLEETPLLYVEDVYFGDEIDTDRDAAGALRFRGVVSRSGYRTYSWLLSHSLAASTAMADLRDAVVAAGGRWEQTFGGSFMAHIPADSAFDPEVAFAGVVQVSKPRDAEA